jgi:hypothetical protein
MPIAFACICPPSADTDAERAAAALATLAGELRAARPELAAVIARQSHVLPRAIGLSGEAALVERVLGEASREAAPVERGGHWEAPPALAELVGHVEVLAVAVGAPSPRIHFEFGRALGRALAGEGRRCALVALARLSGTEGVFERHYQRAIEEWDVRWLAGLDAESRRLAGEDAVAQTAVLMGALSGARISARLLAHEAGALVAAIEVLGPRRGRRGRAGVD